VWLEADSNRKKNDREEGAAVLRPYKGTKWLDGRGFSRSPVRGLPLRRGLSRSGAGAAKLLPLQGDIGEKEEKATQAHTTVSSKAPLATFPNPVTPRTTRTSRKTMATAKLRVIH